MQEIKVTLAEERKQKPTDETKLGFGNIFTDHMCLMDYDEGEGWHDLRIVPYGPFSLDPSAMALHYGQAIFEGTKCYRASNGELLLFRPRDNFVRMSASAERICMPAVDPDECVAALKKLISIERDWVPSVPETTLYIRPFMFATDAHLGVRASHHYLFAIILSPCGAYYKVGLTPVDIFVEDRYVRAVRGGTGFTKVAGNYASSILAGEVAKKKGYSQVLWLDGVEQRYVEEVGAMNMMFVLNGKIVTPALNGSILPGITRDSVLKLAANLGYETEERRVDIHEIMDGARSGALTEAFGTGTAAVISPVGGLCYEGERIGIGTGGIGAISRKLYDTLTGIQYGQIADPFHWSVKLDA